MTSSDAYINDALPERVQFNHLHLHPHPLLYSFQSQLFLNINNEFREKTQKREVHTGSIFVLSHKSKFFTYQ